jgi:hypothetical protein
MKPKQKFELRLQGTIHQIMKSLADWAESLTPKEKSELRKALEVAARPLGREGVL